MAFNFSPMAALTQGAYDEQMNKAFRDEAARVRDGLTRGDGSVGLEMSPNGSGAGAYGQFPNGTGGFTPQFSGYAEPGLGDAGLLDPIDYLAGAGAGALASSRLAALSRAGFMRDGLRAAEESRALLPRPRYDGTQLPMSPMPLTPELRKESDALMHSIELQNELNRFSDVVGKSQMSRYGKPTFPYGRRNMIELMDDMGMSTEDAQVLQNIAQRGTGETIPTEDQVRGGSLLLRMLLESQGLDFWAR